MKIRHPLLSFFLVTSLYAWCGVPADSVTTKAKENVNNVDTAKITQLQELIVQGENAWIEGDKAVFIPSRRDKRLSNSVSTLLDNMMIPMLKVEGSSVTNISGKPVAIFINGIRADDTDYSTFWPKQALRVEYIDHPSDPKFQGEECVVNFIMKRQETGGVAKADASQHIRNMGAYSVATKIEHGKMIYGIKATADYSRDHLSSSKGKETYSDLYYNDTFHPSIDKDFSESSYSRSNKVDAAFNARFVTGQIDIRHTATFRWTHNPGSGTNGRSYWTPPLFSGPAYTSSTKGHSISPQLAGSYDLPLSAKWMLYASWKYAYSHNNKAYSYRQEGAEPIVNTLSEDVNAGVASVSVGWTPSMSFSSFLQVYSSMNWYDIMYDGSSNEHVYQHRGETVAQMNFWWRPSNNFVVSVTPGITVSCWKVGDLSSETETTPRCNVNLGWYPSDKVSVNAGVSHTRKNPVASETSDVMVRQDELVWSAGNPYLKGSDNWFSNIYLTWLPSNAVRISTSVSWSRNTHVPVSLYTSAPREMEGLILTRLNTSPFDSMSWYTDLSFPSFINGIFSASLQPTYTYDVAHGEFSTSNRWLKIYATLLAKLKSVNLRVTYDGRDKRLGDGGILWQESDERWNISASYGNGNWFVHLAVHDIFNSRRETHIRRNGGNLTSDSFRFSNGRCLFVSVSYTFGYGKKVSRSINISGPEDISSGAVEL